MPVAWITASDLDTPGSPYAEEAAEAASQLLYNLSGQLYPGVQTATESYVFSGTECSFDCSGFAAPYGDTPVGQISHTHIRTSYPHPRQLRLRHKRVSSILSVKTGSAVFTDYDLVNNAYLVKRSGASWNLLEGLEVSYRFGTKPTPLARMAAIELGNELMKAYNYDSDCALPERVTSVARQGVTISIADPSDFLDKGSIGLYKVDLFLAGVNPDRVRKRAKIWVPDGPRAERRT